MLEWFVLLAVVAALASLLGYTTVLAGVATLAKFTLAVTLVIGAVVACVAVIQTAKQRKERAHHA
jgi:uncharacterized membrane protein YtjA (UPF0391 family)